MPDSRSAKGHPFEELSYAVIGACIEVQRQLGVHCMEVDYQRALELALRKIGLDYQREVDVPIAYDGVVVTKRRVDFVMSRIPSPNPPIPASFKKLPIRDASL